MKHKLESSKKSNACLHLTGEHLRLPHGPKNKRYPYVRQRFAWDKLDGEAERHNFYLN